ncbi:MAG: glycosyltransferase family 4 protein [Bacteroidales bacterium]|nr:glycosyltransferase family 4 protein [Bacteroidales bacterium]
MHQFGEKSRNIGFISRMCHENGLDILVDAFILLKQNRNNSDIKLTITGGQTGDDVKYIRAIKKKITKNRLNDCVEFQENFEGEGRKDFFKKVSVLSVPVRNGEAFGIYLTEAMAAGIPVVQPALGAFPEIIESSKGGIIYSENTPEKLTQALHELLNDGEKCKEMSQNARNSIVKQFNINDQASELLNVYERVNQNELMINRG